MMTDLPTGYPPQFSRAELIRSARAEALGIPNTPTAQHEQNLRALAWQILVPLRQAMSGPIQVTSGYRSKSLNKNVKGASATSQHMLGQAVDLVTGGTFSNAAMFHYIRMYLPYDQLIWEYGTKQEPLWVHVSYRPNPRGKVLVTTGTPERPAYAPWKA
jgi:zinc D-Ala-D-Ala carboxypeptidase